MKRYNITDMNINGAGITRGKSGAVIFIPGTADGDICDAEINGGGKNYLTAEMRELVSPSEHRCPNGCDAFGECGGCTLRHITYEHELEIKRRAVIQAFRRHKITAEPEEVIPTSPEAYRNKAVFPASGNSRAYFAGKSHRPVYPESGRCAIIPEIFDRLRVFCASYFAERSLALPSLFLRIGDGGAVMLCAAGANADPDKIEGLAASLSDSFPEVVSVYAADREPSLPGAVFTHIRGVRELAITVRGITFSVSPASFFQVNNEGCSELCRVVCEFAAPAPGARIADLYCGCGMFALMLGKAFPECSVTGIEINESAVASAAKNAAENGIGNAEFLCGDAGAYPQRLRDLSCCVVDPPRAGLSDRTAALLLEARPDRIVYVSCNPETLARDIGRLGGSYSIGRMICADMFPRAPHVETVCLLSKLHEAKHHVNVKLDMDEMDITSAESKATYEEIKKYVAEHNDGMKVTNLYIAQVKKKCGIIERENYNKPKSEDEMQPQCPKDKEKAIEDALRYFQMK